jgi:hypothetical protein
MKHHKTLLLIILIGMSCSIKEQKTDIKNYILSGEIKNLKDSTFMLVKRFMNINIIFTLVFTFFLSCTHSNKNIKINQNNTLVWKEFNSKDSIPILLRNKLTSYFNYEFKVANRGDMYNATDVLLDSLPNRQLIYLAKNDNNWRISYIQGGFVKEYVYADGSISGDSVINFRIAESRRILDNTDTINALLKNNLITFKK